MLAKVQFLKLLVFVLEIKNAPPASLFIPEKDIFYTSKTSKFLRLKAPPKCLERIFVAVQLYIDIQFPFFAFIIAPSQTVFFRFANSEFRIRIYYELIILNTDDCNIELLIIQLFMESSLILDIFIGVSRFINCILPILILLNPLI